MNMLLKFAQISRTDYEYIRLYPLTLFKWPFQIILEGLTRAGVGNARGILLPSVPFPFLPTLGHA